MSGHLPAPGRPATDTTDQGATVHHRTPHARRPTGSPVTGPALVAALRETFRTGVTRSTAWRVAQLGALRAMVTEHAGDLVAAVRADLGRSEAQTRRFEIDLTVQSIDYTLAHLDDWLAPERVDISGVLGPAATAATVLEPLGAVLVVGPWNFPVQLVLEPLIGALASGNVVVVKPSEGAPATSRLLARLLPAYLDERAVAVVEGGPRETRDLLTERFDHIFYTGGPTGARAVLRAAAEQLVPVTLELGGKSPVYVDRGLDLADVAQRIVAAKFMNAGQTCVAPDYILADKATARGLEPALATALTALYGPDPATSPEYGRIAGPRHFDRLLPLLSGARVVTGGQADRASLYIAPTVLADVTAHTPAMREEIFGPILPVVAVSGLDEAVEFVNERAKPLALYAFTRDAEVRRRLVEETSCGGVSFGRPLAHAVIPALPFGGVGASGMGAYHGRTSITTFSHRKPVVVVPEETSR